MTARALPGHRTQFDRYSVPGIMPRLIELVSAGDEEGALRMIREAGYDEAEARKVLALVVKVEGYGKPGPGVWCAAYRGDGNELLVRFGVPGIACRKCSAAHA